MAAPAHASSGSDGADRLGTPGPTASRPGPSTHIDRGPSDAASSSASRLASARTDRRPAAPLVLDATRLNRLASPIARRVVRLALRRAGLKGRDFARARIDEVLALASSGEHRSLSLGEAFTARVEYGRLRLENLSGGAAPGRRLRERLDVPGETALARAGLSIRARLLDRDAVADEYRHAPSHRAYVDAASLRLPLTVRSPRPGDRFQPLGAPGTRKLSDVWTDLKIGRDERRRCLIVESEGRVVWAVGLRLADPFRVTDATRSVAILEVVDLPPGAAARGGSTQPGRTVPARDEGGAAAPSLEVPSILYTEEQIQDAVSRLADDVSTWAAGREILVLGVLQGSFIFLADLVRRLRCPLQIGFLDRQGDPIPPFPSLTGVRVLVVEDILDTGESLVRIIGRLRQGAPAEIRTCVLFDKPSGRRATISADWSGLPVPDRWVVGYGLDAGGRDRNLPYLTWV